MDQSGPLADVDTVAVEAWLSDALAVTVADLRVLQQGVNLSLAVRTTDGSEYVLRRPNKLRHTDLFVDIATEYRLMQRLSETSIPAPDPVVFCDDPSLLGDEFFLMTSLEGRGVDWGSPLPERFRTPSARARIGQQYAETLGAIHTADVDRFAAVCERTTPRDQLDRGADRLDRAIEVTGHDVPLLWDILTWLRTNAPSDAPPGLVHGDYKPDNVFLGGTDTPVLKGVVDWETVMLGDPRAELGYFLLYWRDANDSWPSIDAIDTQGMDDDVVRQLRRRATTGFWPFTAASGSPTRQDFVARWEAVTGRSFHRDRFYRVHAAFMLAAVWSDLHRHDVEAGHDSDRMPHVEYIAHLAQAIIAGDVPL